MPNVSIEIKFEPRDLWVGIRWERDVWYGNRFEKEVGKIVTTSVLVFVQWWRLELYICILPMLPIYINIVGVKRLSS